jgi:class 3 adenylate cyclase/predicted ATPase
MTFDEIVEEVRALLQRKGRVAYRALKRRFDLDDDYIEDLKAELIKADRLARDEDGEVLVWTGGTPVAHSPAPGTSPRPPISYTPSHLAARIMAEQAALEARNSTEGERKTITALFADLAGFTALTHDLDPEDARHLIDPALKLMMDAVHRYEGYVAQSLGDGIFALFGAPIAHEDHPQRALYAALAMQAEMRRYAERVRLEHGVPLQMRVGVNTGEVVLRSIRKDDLHTDYVPVGHSTNLASRLESLAMPGSIVVSEHTHKLIEGYFECKALGAAHVKGLSQPVHIYEVLGVGSLRTKLQVAARRGLARFVGRHSELEQLRHALGQAIAGRGQIVGVIGEPGMGKSRLFHEFKLVAQSGCLVLETFSVSHGKAYPYLPLIELLNSYFHILPQDDERRRREKITGRVLTLDRALEDTLPYFFFLLGVADPGSSLQQTDPQIRRRRTFDAIKRVLLRESRDQPLLLIFEDLHWLDNETQAFLSLLGESVATARLLLLVSYRPEYLHSWGSKTYYTQLHLDPLGRAEAQELLTALLGESAALQPLKRFILEKTEGNPFFMEEMVQALIEQGVVRGDGETAPGRPLTELRLPPTVQGVLAARIDHLPAAEKELLQTLAVIGKEFPLGLLRRVVPGMDEEVQRQLLRLQEAEFIYEQPALPEVEYTFKHALTQEVAYNSLLSERRKMLHERTAQAIEALFHSQLEDHYGDLAHHYSRSGNTPKAVEYLQRSGQQAAQRSAYAEAVGHLTAALDLLQALPDTPARAQQELALQLALAVPLQATKGPAGPEIARAYTRARALCESQGETPQLFAVLRGLWVLHHVRAELAKARELGEQLLSMAERGQDPAYLMEAHRALGSTLLWQGEFALARVHLERSSAFYNPDLHRSLIFLHGGADPGVSCFCETARALWFLGYPEQALQSSQAALALAQGLSDPFSLGFALVSAAGLHQFRREGSATQQRAEEAIALASEQGLASLLAAGTIRRGWALAEQGEVEVGLTQMQQGLTARQTTGAELAEPYFLALQAEVYGKVGQTRQALALLTEALAAVQTNGERRLEAELYRLKGELTLRQSGVRSPASAVPNTQHPAASTQAEAEACFHTAVEIARKQSAKSLELRAVMSLSRLWRRQGKKGEAHKLLSEVYGWFTEGFDTRDLREAKALLEELSGESGAA